MNNNVINIARVIRDEEMAVNPYIITFLISSIFERLDVTEFILIFLLFNKSK